MIIKNHFHKKGFALGLVLKQRLTHRRMGNFLPGGAVNHLPKKFLQVAQIFTKQFKRNEGHTMY